MPSDHPKPNRFPFLETILSHRGLSLKAMYSLRDVAEIFQVTIRTIQQRVKAGQLISRDLPGRAKFLSADLEDFLSSSRRTAADSSR